MILYCLLTIGDVQGQCLDLTARPDGGYIVLQYFVDNILRFGLVYWVFGIVDNILGFGLDPSFPFPSFRVSFPSPPATTAPERKEEGEKFEESLR